MSFSAPTDVPGSEPAAVAIGDLDRDGIGGLVTANHASDDIGFFPQNGFGGFELPGAFGVGDAPRAVAIGDLDGDGDLDLAVANFNSSTVSVLRNTGTPAVPADRPAPRRRSSVAARRARACCAGSRSRPAVSRSCLRARRHASA